MPISSRRPHQFRLPFRQSDSSFCFFSPNHAVSVCLQSRFFFKHLLRICYFYCCCYELMVRNLWFRRSVLVKFPSWFVSCASRSTTPSFAVRPQSERLAKLDSRSPPPKRPLPVTSTANRPLSPRNLSPKDNTPRLNISRSLNSIPESTPLPDSPSSFPPLYSYIINHKPRGLRLLDGVPPSDAGGPVAENGTRGDTSDVHVQGEPNYSMVQLHEEKPEDDGLVESDEVAKLANPNCSVNKLDRNRGSVIWKPSTPSGEYFDAFEGMLSYHIILVSDVIIILQAFSVCQSVPSGYQLKMSSMGA